MKMLNSLSMVGVVKAEMFPSQGKMWTDCKIQLLFSPLGCAASVF